MTWLNTVDMWTLDMGDEGAEGHKGAEGAEEDEWAEEDEGGEVAEGADGIDMAAIYILLEHHGNRPYGVMELLSKMSDCTVWVTA